MRWLWRLLALFGLIAVPVALWLIAALIGAIVPGRHADLPDSPDQIEIRLVSGPIHYDFLLPLDAPTRAHFAFLDQSDLPLDHANANASWLLLGWGARTFYTTTGSYKDVSAAAVLRGVFGDTSVMRVDVLPSLGQDGPWASLRLSQPEYQALLTAISDSLARDPHGKALMLDHPGFSSTDRFFEAMGHFNILRTCNVWVGEILRAAGQPFGVWTPTPYSVSTALATHGS